MSAVLMHNVVSVDGFIADEKDDVEPHTVIQGDRVLHLRYRVRPPATA
jgi:hypothetical protein